jgi:uncharacterized protein (TIGR03435 family)
MKPDERNIDEILKHALPSAPRGQMEAALERVHARLQSDPHPRAAQPQLSTESSRVSGWVRPLMRTAAAAVIVAAAVWGGAALRDQGVYAVLEAADGSMYRIANGNHVPIHVGDRIAAQETVRSDGATGAVLALADGSHVEMRSMSELSWDHAADGLKIRLDAGSIIVSSAKQGGRLYVLTKDMTASVTGTTSLVNAAEDGSRVAVIEGEVELREGKSETRLRPGQQVTTSATLASRSLTEDTAWSRNADAYRRILESFNKGLAETRGELQPLNYAASVAQGRASAADPQFEEASIRPCDPDNLPPTIEGARGGGPNSFQMTPGRLHGLCLTLATILRHAYGYGPADLDFLNPGGRGRGLQLNNIYGLGVEDGKRVRGGPDWVRTERYTIDAVAADAADAASMSGPMLRSLLEKRFQLKTHIETEQVRAWTLTIASSGLKMKSVTVDDGAGCDAPPTVAPSQPRLVRAAQPGERQPPPPSVPGQMVTILFRNFIDVRRGEKPTCGISMQRNGPNQVIVAGGTTLEALARSLASPLGGVIVTDKTGNTEKFNIVLEFVRDENTPGPSFLAPNQPEPPSNEPRGQTIFAALEEQLGLKLQPATASREFIVIDRVERPSAN